MSSKRPEQSGPPDLLQMAERAIELLALPEDQPSFILDLGCGSGLSGEALSNSGHHWIGVDVSQAMLGNGCNACLKVDGCTKFLDVAQERGVDGDLLLGDIGDGLSFRPGSLDGAISISAVQWLCHANTKAQHPHKRLYRMFSSLYACLNRGSRAVFQFYPENSAQIELITQQAMKAGFTGGLVVDFPESTRAKKMYLVLFVGGAQPLPAGMTGDGESSKNQISFTERRERAKQVRGKPPKKNRDWILAKKEKARLKGKETKFDSKYTGRKRKNHF